MRLAIIGDDPMVRELLPVNVQRRHDVVGLPAEPATAGKLDDVTIAIVDALGPDLPAARQMCRLVAGANPDLPVAVLIGEGSVTSIDGSWAIDDFIVAGVPAEIYEARFRLMLSREPVPVTGAPDARVLELGDLVVDECTYQAHLGGEPLDLTHKEFELLRYLVRTVGNVHTRERLLEEVWGRGYRGGTRTVDVHVRRIRMKLARYGGIIVTVRNVGYKAVPPGPAVQPQENQEQP